MKHKQEAMFLEYDEDTKPVIPTQPPPHKMKRKAATKSPLGKFLFVLLILCLALLILPYVLDSLGYVNDRLINRGNVNPRGCQLGLGSDRAMDMDVSVIISGERRNDVIVDIIPPDRSSALQVNNQYHKRFIDTDELFIYQTYAWDTPWKSGSYTVVYKLRGQPSKRESLYISGSGDHNIYVECN